MPLQTYATGTAVSIAKLSVGLYRVGTSIATATRSVLPTPYAGAEMQVVKVDSGTEVLAFAAGASASDVSFGSGGVATGGGTGITYDNGDRKFTLRFEGESFHVVADGGGSAATWRVKAMHYNATGGSKGGSERGASVFKAGS